MFLSASRFFREPLLLLLFFWHPAVLSFFSRTLGTRNAGILRRSWIYFGRIPSRKRRVLIFSLLSSRSSSVPQTCMGKEELWIQTEGEEGKRQKTVSTGPERSGERPIKWGTEMGPWLSPCSNRCNAAFNVANLPRRVCHDESASSRKPVKSIPEDSLRRWCDSDNYVYF